MSGLCLQGPNSSGLVDSLRGPNLCELCVMSQACILTRPIPSFQLSDCSTRITVLYLVIFSTCDRSATKVAAAHNAAYTAAYYNQASGCHKIETGSFYSGGCHFMLGSQQLRKLTAISV